MGLERMSCCGALTHTYADMGKRVHADDCPVAGKRVTTYEDLVATDKQTCGACPTQWEGKLKDGRDFYFRYRWGVAYLGVSGTGSPVLAQRTPDGVSAALTFGDGYDGFMDDDTYRKTFVRLYQELGRGAGEP